MNTKKQTIKTQNFPCKKSKQSHPSQTKKKNPPKMKTNNYIGQKPPTKTKISEIELKHSESQEDENIKNREGKKTHKNNHPQNPRKKDSTFYKSRKITTKNPEMKSSSFGRLMTSR